MPGHFQKLAIAGLLLATSVAQASQPWLSATVELDQQAFELKYRISPLPAEAQAKGRQRLAAEIALDAIYPFAQRWLDQALPRDRCARPGRENWVAGPAELELGAERQTLLLHLEMPLKLWWCEELLGRELKASLDGWAQISLPLRLQVIDQQLRLQALPVEARTGGQLGEAAEAWLRWRGTDLGELIDRRIATLRLVRNSWLPSALRLADGHLESARFSSSDGRPTAILTINVGFSAKAWLDRGLGLWGLGS